MSKYDEFNRLAWSELADKVLELRGEYARLTEENRRLNEENFWAGGDRVELEAERDRLGVELNAALNRGADWEAVFGVQCDATREAEAERDALAAELDELREAKNNSPATEYSQLKIEVAWLIDRYDTLTTAMSEVSQDIENLCDVRIPHAEVEVNSALTYLQSQVDDLAETVDGHAKKLEKPTLTCGESGEDFTRPLTVHALNVAPVGSTLEHPHIRTRTKRGDGRWWNLQRVDQYYGDTSEYMVSQRPDATLTHPERGDDD